ncbi:hypothetical protein NUSPORA_00805 [Nucleospora cyclopteri]
MINSNFLMLPKELQADFEKTFNSGNEKVNFVFLRKYLKFLEDDDKSFNKTYIKHNPLEDVENAKFNDKLNITVYEFLYKVINTGYSKKDNERLKADAYNYLGVGYEFGVFTLNYNPYKAFNNYTISAQLNSGLGTFRLAQCFERGMGTPISAGRALSFYRCAAKLGLTDGLHAYAMILYNGYVGATKDISTGLYYLKVAAKKANKLCPYPLYDLGLHFEQGDVIELSNDHKYALNLFTKGAKLGDPNSQFKLGQVYEFGDLKQRKNMKKAIDFYKKAAENGHVEAQYMMSELYLVGKSNIIPRSYEKSYQWARFAATKGHSEAAQTCGDCAYTGTGTNKNILDSLWWYKIAEMYGNVESKDKIKNLESQIERQNVGAEVPSSCCCSCLFPSHY